MRLIYIALFCSCFAIAIAFYEGTITSVSHASSGVDEVAQGLTCQCGCGLTVANCNHPNCSFSVPVRDQIEQMLARGLSQKEIIGYFRKKYGEKILSFPDPHGFNLLAWVTPFVLIALGSGMIFIALRRWRSQTSALNSSPTGIASPMYDARLRRELEKEVRRLF